MPLVRTSSHEPSGQEPLEAVARVEDLGPLDRPGPRARPAGSGRGRRGRGASRRRTTRDRSGRRCGGRTTARRARGTPPSRATPATGHARARAGTGRGGTGRRRCRRARAGASRTRTRRTPPRPASRPVSIILGPMNLKPTGDLVGLDPVVAPEGRGGRRVVDRHDDRVAHAPVLGEVVHEQARDLELVEERAPLVGRARAVGVAVQQQPEVEPAARDLGRGPRRRWAGSARGSRRRSTGCARRGPPSRGSVRRRAAAGSSRTRPRTAARRGSRRRRPAAPRGRASGRRTRW